MINYRYDICGVSIYLFSNVGPRDRNQGGVLSCGSPLPYWWYFQILWKWNYKTHQWEGQVQMLSRRFHRWPIDHRHHMIVIMNLINRRRRQAITHIPLGRQHWGFPSCRAIRSHRTEWSMYVRGVFPLKRICCRGSKWETEERRAKIAIDEQLIPADWFIVCHFSFLVD